MNIWPWIYSLLITLISYSLIKVLHWIDVTLTTAKILNWNSLLFSRKIGSISGSVVLATQRRYLSYLLWMARVLNAFRCCQTLYKKSIHESNPFTVVDIILTFASIGSFLADISTGIKIIYFEALLFSLLVIFYLCLFLNLKNFNNIYFRYHCYNPVLY